MLQTIRLEWFQLGLRCFTVTGMIARDIPMTMDTLVFHFMTKLITLYLKLGIIVWIDTRTLSVHQMQPARRTGRKYPTSLYFQKIYTLNTRHESSLDMYQTHCCYRKPPQFFQLSSKTILWTYCFCFRTYYITYAS